MEAIDNAKNGLEIKPTLSKTYNLPNILKVEFLNNKELNQAFYGFTFGKQKEFASYINNAQQEKTKATRLQKIIPIILDNIGLNDKYRS